MNNSTPWSFLTFQVRKLSERLDKVPNVREATLVSDTAVRFDIDSSDTMIHGSLVSNASPGSRVLTLTLKHYIWVIGVKGGTQGQQVPAASETVAGLIELATSTEVNTGTDAARAVTPATLKSWEAFIRPSRKRAVFIGSSNVAASSTAWPTLLGAERGWTVHNYAIGGTGYWTLPSTDRFRQQVLNAVAGMTVQQRSEVSHFFVGDASNDARSNTSYANVYNEAVDIFASIRSNFPNARIVVVPMIWPADTQKYTPAIWSYDPKWSASALSAAEAQKNALNAYSNALFIDQSWTWLTGRDELMIAVQDVHPNAAGHSLLAKYISRALDGESIVPETAWIELAVPTGYTLGHRGRNLAVKRRGWEVTIDGSMLKNAAISGFAEYGSVPYGFRPTFETHLTAAPTDTGGIDGTALALHVYPTGQIRRYVTTGRLGILTTGKYQIG